MDAWLTSIKYSINTPARLKSMIPLSSEEEAALNALNSGWGTTSYFAGLMDPTDPLCPIRRQVIPSVPEIRMLATHAISKCALPTLLSESETPECIVQKYPDRVAFIVSERCASYCRFCFRKEMVMLRMKPLSLDPEEGLRWIEGNRGIRDVLVTGGDPLILSDAKIEYLVRRLREISHIEMIRFGTRMPIVLPERITPALCKILGGFQRVPMWINTHCNHPKEITAQTAKAIFALLASGVNVGNQAVLLKGINDNVKTLRQLHLKLLSVRIRPYYLFHCEAAPGNEAFRTPIALGAALLRQALSDTTGLARPFYAVDTENGKKPASFVGLHAVL